jgi:hypothetical protein
MTTRKQIQDQAIRNSLNNNYVRLRKNRKSFPDLFTVTNKLKNISQGHVWKELENTKRTIIYRGVIKNV